MKSQDRIAGTTMSTAADAKATFPKSDAMRAIKTNFPSKSAACLISMPNLLTKGSVSMVFSRNSH